MLSGARRPLQHLQQHTRGTVPSYYPDLSRPLPANTGWLSNRTLSSHPRVHQGGENVTSLSCRHERFKPSSGQHHHYDPPARIRRNVPCIRGVTYSTLPQKAASASQHAPVTSQLSLSRWDIHIFYLRKGWELRSSMLG
ncbi:hypothetical protein SMAC4_13819 [Sordaria macrospora]|uniref:uncharacterized protein n=1 Tax=Sordaria macrospora TaxID=5147 RepID=UPI002B309CE4|nr:hypothetical protein SMAC4_13819 [Sordaria macrospora]